jgi:hypothetical protein
MPLMPLMPLPLMPLKVEDAQHIPNALIRAPKAGWFTQCREQTVFVRLPTIFTSS